MSRRLTRLLMPLLRSDLVKSLRKRRRDAVDRVVWQESRGVVQGGPFAGMRYVPKAIGSQLSPKLLGTYEKELQSEIESIISSAPDLVVDIGVAEGYYAVGLAHRLPETLVHGYDTDPSARALFRELARVNDVESRIFVGDECRLSDLVEVLGESINPFVLMDCEGCESHLLTQQLFASNHRVSLIVELHEFIVSDIADKLERTVPETHSITYVAAGDRTVNDLQARTDLPKRFARRALDERRPPNMRWAVCRPHQPTDR